MMNMKQKMDDLKEVLRIEENTHHSKWLAQVTVPRIFVLSRVKVGG